MEGSVREGHPTPRLCVRHVGEAGPLAVDDTRERVKLVRQSLLVALGLRDLILHAAVLALVRIQVGDSLLVGLRQARLLLLRDEAVLLLSEALHRPGICRSSQLVVHCLYLL